MPDSWDRQPTESAKAHRALLDYCGMGPARSMKALLERYVQAPTNASPRPPTLSWTTITTWSHKNDWVKRAAAWDADQERLEKEALRTAINEMAQRQASEGRALQDMAAMLRERLEQFVRVMRPVTVETIDENGQVVRVIRTEIKPGDAANLLRAVAAVYKTGIDAERLARGEATDAVDMRVLDAAAEKLAEETGLPKEAILADFEDYRRRRRA